MVHDLFRLSGSAKAAADFSMTTFSVLVLLLAGAPAEAVAVTPGAVLNAAPSASALETAHVELEASGQMLDAARQSSQLIVPVMRRHEAVDGVAAPAAGIDSTVAQPAEVSLLDAGLVHAPMGTALASARGASLQERHTHRDEDEAEGRNVEAARPGKAAEAPYSGVQAMKGLIPGPIPDSQKQAFAGCMFLFIAGVGFLAYYLYQQWVEGKDAENQAHMRRRMARMRALASAAEAKFPAARSADQLPTPRSDRMPPTPRSEDELESSPSRSFGKGTGGKVGGKGFGGKAGMKAAAAAAPRQALLAEAAGLGIGQKAIPSSVSSRADPDRSSFGDKLAEKALASSAFAVPREPEVSAKVPEKALGKGSGSKTSDSKVQDLLSMLRAVERIQAAWRRWKALQKLPRVNQRISIVCDVLEGTDMPNVNRFGGCDPFIECRVVRGDPSHNLRGDVDKAPLMAAQTEVKRNDLAPRWDQRLALNDMAYEKGLYVQLVLWDYSIMRSSPVGHVALPLEQALIRHGQRRPVRVMNIVPLPGGDSPALNTTISAQFSFWETYRHRLIVVGGSWLPKVKMLGTISAYVEARVLRNDPRKASFVSRPVSPTECLWSGRTKVVADNVDPCWEQEFEFELACDLTSLWLQLVLWDANPPHADAPIGHAVVKISQAVQPNLGGELVDHLLRFEELPERHAVADLSRAKLAFRMGCQPVMGAEQDL